MGTSGDIVKDGSAGKCTTVDNGFIECEIPSLQVVLRDWLLKR